MENQKVYYRLEAIGIDFFSENEVKKYNKELESFETIKKQLDKMHFSFKNQLKNCEDLILNFLPNIHGVFEISVYHKIKYKMFSKIIKEQCFSLCITKLDKNDILYLYDYNTNNFREVEDIFRNIIDNHIFPDLTLWKEQKIC